MMRKSRAVLAITMFIVLALFIPSVSAQSSDTEAGYIVVGIAPAANFEAYYAYNIVPTTVRFSDRTTGTTPMTYHWDFGDGSTSTEQNPVHIYKVRGLYTVKLTATNRYGESTEIKTNFIAIGVGPVADFTADPRTGQVPFVVQFTDQTIGRPTQWVWNFGDGTGSNEQNPAHTYWVGGSYTVTLTASNEYGSSDASKNEFIIAIPALKARFEADPMTGKAPLTVSFTDRTVGNPTSWNWDFGDGSSSTEKNPVHTFTSGGAFDVTLTASRDDETSSYKEVINIGGVPVTDFVADETSVNVNQPIQFTDKTANNPTSWKWDFGDGSESSAGNPVKSYSLKGIYTVSLSTRNDNGKDTEVKKDYINVGLAPIADFITSVPAYQTIPSRQIVRFIDKTRNLPTEWHWDFGDGDTSTDQNPRHVYRSDGTYTVTLTAKNKFGESTKSISNLISVGTGPRIDFKADKNLVGVDRFVRFTDLSTNNPTRWQWDFGDGTTGTGQNPDHAYKAVGIYDVTLTASNQYTSTSLTKKQYITVIDIPSADFIADKTKGNPPMEVHFTDKSRGNPTDWLWEFGDGSTSTGQNPVHSYGQNGVYTVKLTASNQNGEDTKTRLSYITVTGGPIADFTVDQRIGKAPFIVKFKDLSTGDPTEWFWEFGDGTTSTEQHPTHVYPREGSYDVRLTVSNQYGSDGILKRGGDTEEKTIVTTIPTTTVTVSTKTTVATMVTTMKTTVPLTSAKTGTTTKAPLSMPAIIGSCVLSLLAFAALKRR